MIPTSRSESVGTDLRKLQERYPLTTLLEILTVYEGIKPCARIAVEGPDIMEFVQFPHSLGLASARSDFKVVLRPDTGKGKLANTGTYVPLESDEGHFYVYIATSSQRARLAKGAELYDNEVFGQILGYPECCRQFFCEHLENQKTRQMDFIIPSVASTEPASWYANHALRAFGTTLISHFPCSPCCSASEKVGKETWECVKRYFPEVVGTWKTQLKSFVIYTETSGIFYLPAYRREENRILYREVHGSMKNGLMLALQQNQALVIQGVHSFELGNKRIEDSDMVLIGYA